MLIDNINASLEEFVLRKGLNIVGDLQVVFRFPNDYGASVTYGGHSMGLELVEVIFPRNDQIYNRYGSPVGFLTPSKMNELLFEIKAKHELSAECPHENVEIRSVGWYRTKCLDCGEINPVPISLRGQ